MPTLFAGFRLPLLLRNDFHLVYVSLAGVLAV